MSVARFLSSLSFNSTGHFKLIQFADTHVSDCGVKDQKTVALMAELLDAEKPDLVVLTGDNVLGSSEGVCAQPLEFVLRPVVERGLPFALTFGNHDDEGPWTRAQLLEIALRQPGNLTDAGPAELPGLGNYVLRISGSDGRLGAALHLLDSHAYADNDHKVYAYISPLQSDWHREICNAIAAERPDFSTRVPQLGFFHIPLPEYDDAFAAGARSGQKHEKVCCPEFNSGFFEALRSAGHVTGVFVGHDHINDFIADWQGIALGYGRGTGFGCYGKDGFLRGARVFKLTEGQRKFETWVRLEGGVIADTVVC